MSKELGVFRLIVNVLRELEDHPHDDVPTRLGDRARQVLGNLGIVLVRL